MNALITSLVSRVFRKARPGQTRRWPAAHAAVAAIAHAEQRRENWTRHRQAAEDQLEAACERFKVDESQDALDSMIEAQAGFNAVDALFVQVDLWLTNAARSAGSEYNEELQRYYSARVTELEAEWAREFNPVMPEVLTPRMSALLPKIKTAREVLRASNATPAAQLAARFLSIE